MLAPLAAAALMLANGSFGHGFDTLITMGVKDVPVVKILDRIGKASETKISMDGEGSTFKVNVFVKKMPAKDLLQRIASVFDFDATFDGSTCALKFGRQRRLDLEHYLEREQNLCWSSAEAHLNALAKLTSYPFGQTPAAASTPPQNETLDDWARRKIVSPEFYAVGLWYRQRLLAGDAPDASRYLTELPFVIWVGYLGPGMRMKPVNDFTTLARVDAGSAPILCTVATAFCYRATGELRIRDAAKPDNSDLQSERSFVYGHPPKALEKTDFATRLREWDTGSGAVPQGDKVLEATQLKKPDDPGYGDGKISLSEKLEFIHTATGIPIVSTSFRIPTLTPDYPVGSSPRALVADLTRQEEIFSRYEDGTLLVRHPAYWRLMCSEPDEAAIERMESAARSRNLTLRDYAKVAFAIGQCYDQLLPWHRSPSFWDPQPSSRSPHCRGYLFRFDDEPLVRALPALALIGGLNERELAFLTAPTAGVAGDWRNERFQEDLPSLASIINRKYRTKGFIDVRPHLGVVLAPLYPTKITEGFLTMRELHGNVSRPADTDAIKADSIYIDEQPDGHCRIGFGYIDGPVATYDFAIHNNKPISDGDGGQTSKLPTR